MGVDSVWVSDHVAPRDRAAQHGDGWHRINLSPAETCDGVRSHQEPCRRFGRDPSRDVPYAETRRRRRGGPLPGDAGEQAADVRAYRAAEVDELVLSLNVRTTDEL